MIKGKYGQLTFANEKELSQAIDKYIQPILAEAKEQATTKGTETALKLLLPLIVNALYEVQGIGEKRINQFIDRFNVHMECLQDGIVTPEEYRDWCLEQGYKVVEVEEVE